MADVLHSSVSGIFTRWRDMQDGSHALVVSAGAVLAGTPVLHRSGVVAADVLAAMGTVTCTKIAGAGLTGGAYITNVVAGNAYGRGVAKVGSATITTETTNLRINAAWDPVAGYDWYDLYCTTVAALWSGRVTAAQHAAGVLLSTKGAGSAPNSVDIDVIGTGLAGSLAVQNTAYVIPDPVANCAGYQYVDFLCRFSRTGDAVAPSATLCPFFLNSVTGLYEEGQDWTPSFGGASGAYGAMPKRLRVEHRGATVALVVKALAGTGMSLDCYSVLS